MSSLRGCYWERKVKEKISAVAANIINIKNMCRPRESSTVVKHSPHHLKEKGSCLAFVAATGREK
jgi:hypothetical protein